MQVGRGEEGQRWGGDRPVSAYSLICANEETGGSCSQPFSLLECVFLGVYISLDVCGVSGLQWDFFVLKIEPV